MATASHTSKRQYKSAKELQVDKTIAEIQQGVRVLVLMRGLPGSGKSFLAKEIVRNALNSTDYTSFIYSTDDYFINPRTGFYNYNAHKLPEAHERNKIRVWTSMSNGVSPIIIDNTNVKAWEMLPYVEAAVTYHYLIEIVEPYTKWAFKASELAQRNSHNVPSDKIQSMLERYEKNVTVEDLLAAIGRSYTEPPQYRRYPPLFEVPSKAIPNQSKPISNSDLIDFSERTGSPDVICISDEELEQVASVQGKHNLCTTSNALESEMKKARTYMSAEKPSPTRTASEICKDRDVYPQLNLASWGLNENAVSSWEAWGVARPLKCKTKLEDEIVSDREANSNIMETSDATTNTNSYDFTLLGNVKKSPSQSVQNKILTANNRDINEGAYINPYPISPPKRMLLHKSSMTDDSVRTEESVTHYDNQRITDLSALFPNIPIEYLQDVIEKCKGDIDWAVDLLLDDTREILPVASVAENMQDLKITSNSPMSTPPENAATLQKHIENVIEINQNHYSDHLLKLKSQRQACTERPSTSQEQCLKLETVSTTNESIVLDSDTDSDSEDVNEELIELNLGENVISQLEAKLGFENVMPDGFLPVVQLPISVARQLYVTYVESILGQIDLQNQVLETIVKQDEEFALKLQKQEQESLNMSSTRPQDLPEIMKEQAASNIYQQEVAKWKKETPDDLATKMTLQKLFTAFPRINYETLMEIYHAYNNSYNDTVEVLLASTDPRLVNDPEGTLKDIPITEVVVSEMKEAENDLKDYATTTDVAKSAQEYRDEADEHHRKHNELISKALEAYQRKQYPVAQFYSDLAKTHTQLFDQANNLAASSFLNEHSQKLQSFHTLDLHFLYVKEAVAALDMFIDKNVHLLNDKKPSEHLFIITGRGKRSEDGKSKLKPVIMARLRKRKIRYWEINPGLLKIRVMHTSALTSNI